MSVTVITFGTFDLFHYGHLKILERASSLGDRLVVGVSTDELNKRKKGKLPIIPFVQRSSIVQSLSFVDKVFAEDSLELKEEYIRSHGASVLVMGDDWSGKFDDMPCESVVYLKRTAGVSTTELIKRIKNL